MAVTCFPCCLRHLQTRGVINGMVTLKFNSTENQNCELMIIDITGREIIHQHIQTSAGINENTFDISNCVKGIYLVKLRTSNKEIVSGMVKE